MPGDLTGDKWEADPLRPPREGSPGRTRPIKTAGTALSFPLDLGLHHRVGSAGLTTRPNTTFSTQQNTNVNNVNFSQAPPPPPLSPPMTALQIITSGGVPGHHAGGNPNASSKRPDAGPMSVLQAVPDVSYLRDNHGHGRYAAGAHYSDVSAGGSIIPVEYHIVEKTVVPPADPSLASAFHPEDMRWHTTVFPPAKPTSRADVLLLSKWCDYMVTHEIGSLDPARLAGLPRERVEELEAEHARRSRNMWTMAFHELNRQVSLQCAERGELLERIFSEYFASTHRLVSLAEGEKERAVAAIREKYKRQLAHERAGHAASHALLSDASRGNLSAAELERDKYINFSNKLKTLLENRDNKLAHASADIRFYEGKMAFVQRLLDEAEIERKRIRNKYGEDEDGRGQKKDVFASLAAALKDMKKGAPKDTVQRVTVNYDAALNNDGDDVLAALADPGADRGDEARDDEVPPVLKATHALLDEIKRSLDPSERFTLDLLLQEIYELVKGLEAKVRQLHLSESLRRKKVARRIARGLDPDGTDDDEDHRFEGAAISDEAHCAASVQALWDTLTGKGRKRPLPKYCSNCPIEVRAVMRCTDCREAFCTKCATSIHRIPILRNHDVRPILDVLDEYLVDVAELPDGWDPEEDARRKARKAAMEEIELAQLQGSGETDEAGLAALRAKKHTRIVYQLTPDRLAVNGACVDEDGVPYGDEEGPLGFAEATLMDIGLFRDSCTITNRYHEPWAAKEVSDNNVATMTFIDMVQVGEWQEHVCPLEGRRPREAGDSGSSSSSSEAEDVKARRRNRAMAALLGKKIKPTRRNAYSMVIPAKLLRTIENIPNAPPPGQVKPLRWILRYIASIYEEKIKIDTIDDREGNPRQELREFVYDFHINRYGLPQLAEKQIVYFMHSVWAERNNNPRVKMFSRFCGLADGLPLKSLSFYLYVANTIFKTVEKSSLEAQMWLRASDAEEERPCIQVNHVLESFKFIFGRSTPQELSEFTLQLLYDLVGRGFRGSTKVALDDILDAVLMEWHRLRELFDIPVQALFFAADINNDGLLDYEEFRRVLRLLFPAKGDEDVMRMYKFALMDTTVFLGLDGMSMEVFMRQMQRYGIEHISTAPPMGRVGPIIAPTFEYLEISSRTMENDVQGIVSTLRDVDEERASQLENAYKHFRGFVDQAQRPDIAWCSSMLLRSDVDFYRRKQKQYGGSYNQKELAKTSIAATVKKDEKGKDLKDVVSARYVAYGLGEKEYREYKQLVFQKSTVKDAADKLQRTASILAAFRGSVTNGSQRNLLPQQTTVVGYFDADGNWIEETRVVNSGSDAENAYDYESPRRANRAQHSLIDSSDLDSGTDRDDESGMDPGSYATSPNTRGRVVGRGAGMLRSSMSQGDVLSSGRGIAGDSNVHQMNQQNNHQQNNHFQNNHQQNNHQQNHQQQNNQQQNNYQQQNNHQQQNNQQQNNYQQQNNQDGDQSDVDGGEGVVGSVKWMSAADASGVRQAHDDNDANNDKNQQQIDDAQHQHQQMSKGRLAPIAGSPGFKPRPSPLARVESLGSIEPGPSLHTPVLPPLQTSSASINSSPAMNAAPGPGFSDTDLFKGAQASTGSQLAQDRRKAMRDAQQKLRSLTEKG